MEIFPSWLNAVKYCTAPRVLGALLLQAFFVLFSSPPTRIQVIYLFNMDDYPSDCELTQDELRRLDDVTMEGDLTLGYMLSVSHECSYQDGGYSCRWRKGSTGS